MTDMEYDASPSQIQRAPKLEVMSRAILVLSTLIVASVAIAFMLLALPTNDDFDRATRPIKFGFWKYFIGLYMNWQGRWVSFGLESAILPKSNMTSTYPALLAGVAMADLLGLYIVCRFFTRSASRWFSLACTLCLAAVFWAQIPSLAQTLYWFVGGVENVMVLSIAGMLLVGMISFRPGIPWICFASIVAIVTTGFHEMYGAMLCICLATGTVAAYVTRSKNRLAWAIVLIAGAIGLAIVVAAPGNAQRMHKDNLHHQRHLVGVLGLSAKQLWTQGRQWLFDPKLVAASLFVAFSPKLEASRPVWVTIRNVPWRLLIPLTWLAMLCVGFFMPSWAFVDLMPQRTLSGNYLVFALGWLVIVFIWTRRLDLRDTASMHLVGPRSAGATSIALLLLSASLVLGGNTFEGIHDLASRKVFRWRDSAKQRYAMLRGKGANTRVVPHLAPSSRLLYSGEIWIDPQNWTNQSLADYFGLNSLRVEADPYDSTTTPTTEPTQPSPNF